MKWDNKSWKKCHDDKNIEITYFQTYHIKYAINELFLLYEDYHIDSIPINITGNLIDGNEDGFIINHAHNYLLSICDHWYTATGINYTKILGGN